MSKLVTRVLGEEAWLRMVSNAPAAWEEDDALRHMSDVLRRPALSEYTWLLLPQVAGRYAEI